MVPHIANLYPQLAGRTTTTTTSVRRSCWSNRGLANLLGRGVLVVDGKSDAQPWPELQAQMERFLELTFLVVRREEAQVSECWCPDEQVRRELVVLGWPEEGIWTREELCERMGDLSTSEFAFGLKLHSLGPRNTHDEFT